MCLYFLIKHLPLNIWCHIYQDFNICTPISPSPIRLSGLNEPYLINLPNLPSLPHNFPPFMLRFTHKSSWFNPPSLPSPSLPFPSFLFPSLPFLPTPPSFPLYQHFPPHKSASYLTLLIIHSSTPALPHISPSSYIRLTLFASFSHTYIYSQLPP